MLKFTRKGNKKEVQIEAEDVFSFGCVSFEFPKEHTSGGTRGQSGQYSRLGLMRDFWIGDIFLGHRDSNGGFEENISLPGVY